jgi:hypothetical protein
MYFQVKNTLKNNHNHTPNEPQIRKNKKQNNSI